MNAPLGLPGHGPLHRYAAREALGWRDRGHIDGLTLSNDTTDATNDLAVAAGSARSTCCIVDGEPSTLTRHQIDLDLPVSIIKQLDVAFAPENYDPDGYSGGDRSGGRSSSSLADGSWHAILAGGRGMQTDVFLHDSATQANVLAEMQKIGGYQAYRRLGSFTRSTSIRPFVQHGDEFLLKTPLNSYSATNPGTSAVTVALTGVPTGVKMIALATGYALFASSNAGSIRVFSPDQTDAAVDSTNLTARGGSSTDYATFQLGVRTDTSAQIKFRLSVSAAASDAVLLGCYGWIDKRDRDI